MATDIVTLKSTIKSTLEAIVEDGGSTKKIKIVYNYPESNPTGYPYAWIDYRGDESTPHTNIDDLVDYTFEVNLIQEKIEDLKGRENAEATAEAMSYALNEAFRAINKLSTADVIRVSPISTEKSYVDNNTRIMLKVVLVIQTKETISL